MYTIGQISEMFQLPISTLRYYDKEGLFPDLERSSGIRRFSEKEIEALRVIECLKKSGLEIKDIKLFMEWCSEGSATYQRRKELFERQKEIVQKEIAKLEKVCFNSNAGTMIRQSKTGTKTESKAFCPIVSQKTFRKYTIVLTMINRREMFPF